MLKSLQNITKVKYFWYIMLAITLILVATLYITYTGVLKIPSYVDNKEFEKNKQGGKTKEEQVDIYFFHTSWCPHCKTAFPIWERVKSELPVVNGVEINYIEVDCENDSVTAEKYAVTGYPTIKMVRGNKVIEYDAKPEIETLKTFVKTSI